MATATEASTPAYLQSYLSQYEASRPDTKQIGQRVTSAIKSTAVTAPSGVVRSANKAVQAMGGKYNGVLYQGPSMEQSTANAAIKAYESQVKAAKDQAANYGEALKTRAESIEGYITNLRSQASLAVAGMSESLAAWNRYATTADQYVQDTTARIAQVTADIKGTIEKYADTNDSALANSIQAASYSWLQTNKATQRAIAERYGTNSAEYRDYLDAKSASLGALVSDLTAQAWDKTQTILNTGLGALAQVEDTGTTQLGWAQKNSLDALQAAAAAGDQYRLQTSSYLLSLAAAEDAAWAELADWINSAPVTAVDATPMFSLLMELEQGQKAQQTPMAATMNLGLA